MKKENLVLKQACIDLGGQAEMARLLGLSAPTINQWINGVRQIPAERCPEIEKATSGTVTCEELRPDIDWAYLRATRSHPTAQKTDAA